MVCQFVLSVLRFVAVAALPVQDVDDPAMFIVWPVSMLASVATVISTGAWAADGLLFPSTRNAVTFWIFAYVTTELAIFAVVETTPSAMALAEPAVRLDAVPVNPVPGPEKLVPVTVAKDGDVPDKNEAIAVALYRCNVVADSPTTLSGAPVNGLADRLLM